MEYKAIPLLSVLEMPSLFQLVPLIRCVTLSYGSHDTCRCRFVIYAAVSKLLRTLYPLRYISCYCMLYLVPTIQHMNKCLQLTEEFRHLSENHSNHEDKLQVCIN